jgi:hypothetical protein
MYDALPPAYSLRAITRQTDSTGKTRNLNNKPARPKMKKLKPVAKSRQLYDNFRIIFCTMSSYARLPKFNDRSSASRNLKRLVIIQDSRLSRLFIPFGRFPKPNACLTRPVGASYDSIRGWIHVLYPLTKWVFEPIEFPIHIKESDNEL